MLRNVEVQQKTNKFLIFSTKLWFWIPWALEPPILHFTEGVVFFVEAKPSGSERPTIGRVNFLHIDFHVTRQRWNISSRSVKRWSKRPFWNAVRTGQPFFARGKWLEIGGVWSFRGEFSSGFELLKFIFSKRSHQKGPNWKGKALMWKYLWRDRIFGSSHSEPMLH